MLSYSNFEATSSDKYPFTTSYHIYSLRTIIMNATIEKYGNRNWAVRINGELLAVTVYKKGARAIVEFIHQLDLGKLETTESKRLKVAV